MEQGNALNVGIVGGGSISRVVMEIILNKKFKQLGIKIIGLADSCLVSLKYLCISKVHYIRKDLCWRSVTTVRWLLSLNYAALFPKTSSACPFANFRSNSLSSKWIFVLEKPKTPSYRSKTCLNPTFSCVLKYLSYQIFTRYFSVSARRDKGVFVWL